jgi:hypothetical protein
MILHARETAVAFYLHFRRIPALINQIALAKKTALDDGW